MGGECQLTDSCFQSVKVIKFESNSQLTPITSERMPGCFQSVKVIKFESNSQPETNKKVFMSAVSSLSKL